MMKFEQHGKSEPTYDKNSPGEFLNILCSKEILELTREKRTSKFHGKGGNNSNFKAEKKLYFPLTLGPAGGVS